MGRNDRWKNGWELVLILALIYAVSAAPTCREDQKLRRNENDVICCYTARCNTSQKFEFCKQDQGRDICVNCPPGTYTNDKINTAQWDEESDFCVPIPLCNSDEVISIGNECACNLAKGYWGVDSRNCQLDKYNCKRAGHQLRQKDGVCISCDEDKFKPEDGTYGVCQIKTKCKAGEEEVDGKSKERDRKCRAIQIVTTSTLAPPTITTNTEPPNEEKKNDDEKSIIVWLLPVCGSVALICVAVCLWWKCRIRIQESFGNLCCQRHGTRNRSEDLPMNGKFQNGQKPSDCKSNGSDEQQLLDSSLKNGHAKGTDEADTSQTFLLDSSLTNGHVKGTDEADTSQTFLLDSSLTNGHATNTDEADKSQTFVTSVLDSEQPPLDSSLTNGHTTSTDDSENAETDAPQTFLKSIADNDEEYPSLGESIFDNDKITSLEQNNGSLIGTQMSTASNDKTSPGSANNTGGNSVYDTASTGSTGNIPDSNLFHSLYTTVSNTIHNHDIEEGPKSKAVNSMTGNTEAPTNKMKTMPTASNTTPNHREISTSKAASSMTGNTEASTNKTRPTAIASRVTGNTEPPTNNTKPIAAASHVTGNTQPPTKPVAAVRPFLKSESSTSSESQENTAPNHDQRSPASPTTDGGVDIQTAVNEENSKVVPNAPYPFEQQSHMNLDRNLPPDEPSGSLNDNVAVGDSSHNDDSIVTETRSEPTQYVNMDGGNIYLPQEETSERLNDYVTVGSASRNAIERTSAGENGSGLRTVNGNSLATPESTSTTGSNTPSLPSVEIENPDSITESEGSELTSRETTFQ